VALLQGIVLISCGGSPTEPEQSIPADFNKSGACVARARFGDPASSPYVLPYPPGTASFVSQSYCFIAGGHRDQLAYDFDFPIGSPVVAARAGTVRRAEDSFEDDNNEAADRMNAVWIEHDDGTAALYAHLQQDGVVVQVDQRVALGELIGTSGNSGPTGNRPHLHFRVFLFFGSGGRDLAINFRNSEGELDGRQGLKMGVIYRASSP